MYGVSRDPKAAITSTELFLNLALPFIQFDYDFEGVPVEYAKSLLGEDATPENILVKVVLPRLIKIAEEAAKDEANVSDVYFPLPNTYIGRVANPRNFVDARAALIHLSTRFIFVYANQTAETFLRFSDKFEPFYKIVKEEVIPTVNQGDYGNSDFEDTARFKYFVSGIDGYLSRLALATGGWYSYEGEFMPQLEYLFDTLHRFEDNFRKVTHDESVRLLRS
jgi:hypothetical protein